MKNKFSVMVLVLICTMFFSCNKNEYKRTENGTLMKFYSVNANNEKPELGDLVVIDATQKIADSVLFSSETMGEPFEILIEEPTFVGDIMCALMSMHLNDAEAVDAVAAAHFFFEAHIATEAILVNVVEQRLRVES